MFVDDITLAESINLKENLKFIPESVRPLPDSFHAKTGHVLPPTNSQVHKQLLKNEQYSVTNSMQINNKKTEVILFNPCIAWDFMPEMTLDNQELEMVEEMKLLGVVVRSDLKWSSNTKEIVGKSYKRLWSLRRLKGMGATVEDLKDVCIKQVRRVLEFAEPAWNGDLKHDDKQNIERVQRTALHIMLGESYHNYTTALDTVGLESLHARRHNLCLKFARKSTKHPSQSKWFVPAKKPANTRQKLEKFCPVYAMHTRFKNSPISYLTNLLNSDN